MSSTDTPTKPQKNAASAVSISYGMATASFDLAPVLKPAEKGKTTAGGGVAFKLICPTCVEPTAVTQHYACPESHARADGPFTETDLHRARDIDGTLHRVSAEEIAQVRTGSPAPGGDDDGKKNISLDVVPAEQVEAVTLPGAAGYRVRLPAKANASTKKVYRLLLGLAACKDYALVGTLRIRGSKLYRLGSYQGQVTLMEVTRTEAIAAVDAIDVEPPSEVEVAKIAELLALQAGDFDPEEYRDGSAERAAALDAAKAAGESIVDAMAAAAPAAAPADGNLEDLLAAMLAQGVATPPRTARPRKAPAKRTPAKKETNA